MRQYNTVVSSKDLDAIISEFSETTTTTPEKEDDEECVRAWADAVAEAVNVDEKSAGGAHNTEPPPDTAVRYTVVTHAGQSPASSSMASKRTSNGREEEESECVKAWAAAVAEAMNGGAGNSSASSGDEVSLAVVGTTIGTDADSHDDEYQPSRKAGRGRGQASVAPPWIANRSTHRPIAPRPATIPAAGAAAMSKNSAVRRCRFTSG